MSTHYKTYCPLVPNVLGRFGDFCRSTKPIVFMARRSNIHSCFVRLLLSCDNDDVNSYYTSDIEPYHLLRDTLPKKYWTLAQNGGGGSDKIPNYYKYPTWDITGQEGGSKVDVPKFDLISQCSLTFCSQSFTHQIYQLSCF